MRLANAAVDSIENFILRLKATVCARLLVLLAGNQCMH